MARYIDLDEAIKHLQFDCKAKYPLSYCNGISAAIREIGKLPTADVISKEFLTRKEDEAYERGYAEAKREVAMEIFEEIEEEINAALQSNYKVLPIVEESEALWNRVNGKIDALRGINGFIDELKETYLKEGTDE